jgi:hypothetical protein
MFTDRKSLIDDRLFAVLLLVPTLVAGSRYFETKSEMDLIAMQNKPAAALVAHSSKPDPIVLAEACR